MEETPEATDGLVTVIGTPTDEQMVDLLRASLREAMHLKPLWERIHLTDLDGQTYVGVPLSNKVTDDALENHSRHFFSLLNLLGIPLVPRASSLQRLEVQRTDLVQLDHVEHRDDGVAAP